MSHLDEGVLHELLDGEIPSSQLGPIQAHLAACAECRTRLDAERQLLADVDGLIDVLEVPEGDAEPTMVRASPRPATPWVRNLAWAAMVVVAVGVGYLARGSQPPAAGQQLVAAPPDTNAAAERPAPASSAATANATVPPGAPPTVVAKSRAPEPAVRSQLAEASGAAAPAASNGRPANAPSGRRVDSLAPTVSRTTPDTSAQKAIATVEARESVRNVAAVAPPNQLASQSQDAARLSGAGRGGRGQMQALARDVRVRTDTISLPDAMRRLGGTLRLIDGVVPLRLELQEPYVRVVYPGDLVLRQQLIDGRIVFQLLAPAGFPPDSLAVLRARIRE